MSRLKGFKLTEEHKRKIGLANSISLKGKKQSELTILKRSQSLKGRSTWNKGKKHSLETKQKMRLSHLGKKYKPMSLTGRLNLSKAHIGNLGWNKGKKMSKEFCEKISRRNKLNKIIPPSRKGCKMSESAKIKISEKLKGDKSYFWKGGISFEPYSLDWTRTLRRSIREKDKYTCQLCYTQQTDNAFDIHHIDYDKKNCNPTNLIMLCRSCHAKTNINRNYWKGYFNER